MKVTFSNTDPWKGTRWNMEVYLHAVCQLEGKKEEITKYGDDRRKYAVVYPAVKIRKLFRLIVQNVCDFNELNRIQSYLNKNSRSYGKIFSEIRHKNGR